MTVIKFPTKRRRRSRVSKAAQERVRWVGKVLNEGGVSIPESEIATACNDYWVLIHFAWKYGQNLDWLTFGDSRMSTYVWLSYNTRN